MTLHQAIQSLTILFPKQGKQGVNLPTIGGRSDHFFRVFYYANGQHISLRLESSSGNSRAEISEYVWNTVYARYQTLEPQYRTITTNYWNNWENRPAGLTRNITPYVAGLIHRLTQQQ